MEKIKKKGNALIKRKNLALLLRANGIRRVNINALVFLESHVKKEIEIIAELLKEELLIKGKKTLEKEDVKAALGKLKKEEVSWEI